MRTRAILALVVFATACASAGRFPELAEAERNAFNRCWYRVVEGRCGAASLYQDDCTRSHQAEYAARDEARRGAYLGGLGCVPEPVSNTDTVTDTVTDTDSVADSGTVADAGTDAGTSTGTSTGMGDVTPPAN